MTNDELRMNTIPNTQPCHAVWFYRHCETGAIAYERTLIIAWQVERHEWDPITRPVFLEGEIDDCVAADIWIEYTINGFTYWYQRSNGTRTDFDSVRAEAERNIDEALARWERKHKRQGTEQPAQPPAQIAHIAQGAPFLATGLAGSDDGGQDQNQEPPSSTATTGE